MTKIWKSVILTSFAICASVLIVNLLYLGSDDAESDHHSGFTAAMARPIQQSDSRTTVPPQNELLKLKDDTKRESELLQKFHNLTYGEEYRQISVELAKYYAKNNPRKGLAWLNELESSPENIPAANVFGGELAKNAPDSSMLIGREILSGGLRQAFFRYSLVSIALKDPKSSQDLLEKNAGYLTNVSEVARSVLDTIAMSADPKSGWEFYIAFEEKMGRKSAIESFFRNCAVQDAETSFKYVAKLKTVPEQTLAIKEVFTGASSASLMPASSLLNTLPSGEVKDAGISQLVERIMYQSPVDAATWAISISQESLRKNIYSKVVQAAKSFDISLADEIAQRFDSSTPPVNDSHR